MAHSGNIYLSMDITIPASNEYSLMEENKNIFYDWNYDWDKRRYFTNFLLRNATDIIEISFHKDYNNWITIETGDNPFILEDFIYRDVYFRNNLGTDVTFNIILISPQSISIPPNKPTNLTATFLNDEVVLTFKDNSQNEDLFYIERSIISSVEGVEGFGVIGTKKYTTEQVVGSIERTYIDSTVSSPNTYWYRIRAEKNGTSSFYSETVEVTI